MKAIEGGVRATWRRNPFLLGLSYVLLISASAICFIPFLWLLSASAKVDREIYSEDRMAPPAAPNALLASPFIDKKAYRTVTVDQDHITLCETIIDSRNFAYPNVIDAESAKREMAKGFAAKLSSSMPEGIWKQGGEQFRIEAEKQLTIPLLQQLFDSVYRRLEFGELILKSTNQEVQTLGSELPFDKRLNLLTTGTATVEQVNDMASTCTLIRYDFTRGSEVVFEQRFRSSFDLRTLKRIQLGLHPDDNWQLLHLTIEMLGARYEAARDVALANYDWYVQNWQEPGPDDESNRVRNWVHIRRMDSDSRISQDPYDVKVRLTLSRATPIRAWWEKLINNYRITGEYIPFFRYLWTTVYLVILNIGLTLASCSLVAYGLTRVKWPGREFVFALLLATLMIPAQVTMIPGFLIWKNLGLYNTLAPLWLGSAFGSAVYIFLLRQFMRGIPRDIEDAAKIDGCGVLRVYWHIVLPLVRPTLAAIALLTFVATWNEFKTPLLYLADQRLYPLAFGLYAFSVQVASNPAQTMAASVLMSAPVLLLFLAAQRHFIRGVTLTTGK